MNLILSTVSFGSSRKGEKEPLEDIADLYLSCLSKQGQICGEYFLTWIKGRLVAHVNLAGPDAFALKHHSHYGKRYLRSVIKSFGKEPVWKVLEDVVSTITPTWKQAPFLYLFTHAFDWKPPISRSDGKSIIPTYLLPISSEQKESLFFWQDSYRLHDDLWIKSGALEIPAYRQLANPDSDLSETGRRLCRNIEEATRIPTFYYLSRYWARPKGEEKRRCPGCGGSWRTESLGKDRSFKDFDFKCDSCRLVSHLGVSTDGGCYARIGEYQVKKAR